MADNDPLKPALEAMKLAAKDADGRRNHSGTITCPKCGGVLRYKVMSNGHIHGQCDGGDVGWMM